jgi:TonB family protein
VQPGALTLLHRAPVQYPKEALAKRIEGTVVLEITLSETGTVSDARVLSGPDELRSAALQSVLQWHYANDARVPAKAQVTVDFRLPESSPVAISRPIPAMPPDDAATLEHLVLLVPEAIKQKIEDRLTVHEGDRLTQAAVSDLSAAVLAVDEHLKVAIQTGRDKRASTVIITLDGANPAQPMPGKIQVGGEIQDVNLVKKVTPEYPPLAKQARIQGVVRFNVIIGKDGSVQNVQLINGHPLLVQPAKDALVQWVYKPTLLNGQPVEVSTQVELAFTLSQ